MKTASCISKGLARKSRCAASTLLGHATTRAYHLASRIKKAVRSRLTFATEMFCFSSSSKMKGSLLKQNNSFRYLRGNHENHFSVLKPHKPSRNQILLNAPRLEQVDDFSCGFVAATIAVLCRHRSFSYKKLYNAIDPSPIDGCQPRMIRRSLVLLNIPFVVHRSPRFELVAKLIRLGYPIISTNQNGNHWITIVGVDEVNRSVLIYGDGQVVRKWNHFKDEGGCSGEAFAIT